MEQQGNMAGQGKQAPESACTLTGNYLEYVLDNTADAIGIMDRHGKAVRWNKAAAHLFGYTLGELKTMHVFDLYPDKEALDKMLTVLRQKGVVRRFEINVMRKDGRVMPFEMSIALLKNKNGQVAGSVGVARDLSEIKKVMSELKALNEELQEEIKKSKRMEDELRKARDQMEKLVEERTAKLSKAGELLQKSMKRIRDITEDA